MFLCKIARGMNEYRQYRMVQHKYHSQPVKTIVINFCSFDGYDFYLLPYRFSLKSNETTKITFTNHSFIKLTLGIKDNF